MHRILIARARCEFKRIWEMTWERAHLRDIGSSGAGFQPAAAGHLARVLNAGWNPKLAGKMPAPLPPTSRGCSPGEANSDFLVAFRFALLFVGPLE